MSANFTLTDNTQTPQQAANVFTFPSVTFGTGSSDIAVVGYSYEAATTPPTVTINGSAATVVDSGVIGSGGYGSGFAYLAAGALTTAAVVFIFGSDTDDNVAIQAGKITGTSSTTASATAVATSAGTSSPGANVPSGGVGIVQAAAYFTGGGGGTITFSGSTNDPGGDGHITNSNGNGATIYTAHTLTAGSPSTISATYSNSFGGWAMISFAGGGGGGATDDIAPRSGAITAITLSKLIPVAGLGWLIKRRDKMGWHKSKSGLWRR